MVFIVFSFQYWFPHDWSGAGWRPKNATSFPYANQDSTGRFIWGVFPELPSS
jgi:hypothetical protein